jgi:hypothetical protein
MLLPNSILCVKKLKSEKREYSYRFIRRQGDQLIVRRCNVFADAESVERWDPEQLLDPARVVFVLPPNPNQCYAFD